MNSKKARMIRKNEKARREIFLHHWKNRSIFEKLKNGFRIAVRKVKEAFRYIYYVSFKGLVMKRSRLSNKYVYRKMKKQFSKKPETPDYYQERRKRRRKKKVKNES